MAAGGASKGNGTTNRSLVTVEYLGPRPSTSLSSDLILLAHALIVRLHLFVSKNPEKPKKVSVDLTGHTCNGRCKRLANEPINVFVFVVLKINLIMGIPMILEMFTSHGQPLDQHPVGAFVKYLTKLPTGCQSTELTITGTPILLNPPC